MVGGISSSMQVIVSLTIGLRWRPEDRRCARLEVSLLELPLPPPGVVSESEL